MLRGSARARVDEKGRLKLPAAFRAAIEPAYGAEFFVTSLRGESVRLYPMGVWREIEDRLSRTPSLNPAVMRFKDAVNYYGQTALMDPQGRVLVHPMLRGKAGVDGDVTVLGQQNYLEVWNRRVFDERMDLDPLTDGDLAALSEMGI